MKCTDNILTYKSSDGMNIQANIAHMQQHLDSLPFIQEALDKINTKNQEFVKVEIDLGRVIGTTTLVKTTDSDEIVFAIRNDRRILSRFVKNREGQPCQTIVIILRKLEGIRYKLLTAYIGRLAEKEAGDHSIMTESEYATCKAFWNEHALLWDESSVKYIAFPGEEEKLPKPIWELRKQMAQAA